MSLILSLYEKRQRILCCSSSENLFFLLSSEWLVILNSVEFELVQHGVLSEESVMWSQKHGFNAVMLIGQLLRAELPLTERLVR